MTEKTLAPSRVKIETEELVIVVVNREGQPLAGTTVVSLPTSMRRVSLADSVVLGDTDKKGIFRIDWDQSLQSRDVVLRSAGYAPGTILSPDAASEYRVIMTRASPLTVMCMSPRGHPVANVDVVLSMIPPSKSPKPHQDYWAKSVPGADVRQAEFQASSTIDGEAVFESLPQGRYVFDAQHAQLVMVRGPESGIVEAPSQPGHVRLTFSAMWVDWIKIKDDKILNDKTLKLGVHIVGTALARAAASKEMARLAESAPGSIARAFVIEDANAPEQLLVKYKIMLAKRGEVEFERRLRPRFLLDKPEIVDLGTTTQNDQSVRIKLVAVDPSGQQVAIPSIRLIPAGEAKKGGIGRLVKLGKATAVRPGSYMFGSLESATRSALPLEPIEILPAREVITVEIKLSNHLVPVDLHFKTPSGDAPAFLFFRVDQAGAMFDQQNIAKQSRMRKWFPPGVYDLSAHYYGHKVCRTKISVHYDADAPVQLIELELEPK